MRTLRHNKGKRERKGDRKMATRPVEIKEYQEIIGLMNEGFPYEVEGKEKVFRPNYQVSLALQLQASLGLRIGDVLDLRLNSFKNGKLEIMEGKTDKLQYRDIDQGITNAVYQYAVDNNIKNNDKLFNIGVRAVQKQLKIVTDYLGLDNISTHSFRKLYAVTAYENNNNNIELVKELLNHTSIATTQRYIRVSQQAINQASKNINYMM